MPGEFSGRNGPAPADLGGMSEVHLLHALSVGLSPGMPTGVTERLTFYSCLPFSIFIPYPQAITRVSQHHPQVNLLHWNNHLGVYLWRDPGTHWGQTHLLCGCGGYGGSLKTPLMRKPCLPSDNPQSFSWFPSLLLAALLLIYYICT